MHIAGGLYHELCEVPEFNTIHGSGGRAAVALSALSPGSTLHTYISPATMQAVGHLKGLGLRVRGNTASQAIAFSYFHPLSTPHIAPSLHTIEQNAALSVEGDAVLRFGLLEGEAIVDGQRVVYDPQTKREPASFRANGSKAESLALVMNMAEVAALATIIGCAHDIATVLDAEGASVAVVKNGVHGASVHMRNGQAHHVPPFRTPRVFKIGSGDVFSAVFSHYWAELSMDAPTAALMASRAVASYCQSRILPPGDGSDLKAVQSVKGSPAIIEIIGFPATIGQRWTIEEARFRLGELGVKAFASSLGSGPGHSEEPTARLVLLDCMEKDFSPKYMLDGVDRLPTVILGRPDRLDEMKLGDHPQIQHTCDFASALYCAAWAAISGTTMDQGRDQTATRLAERDRP